MISCVPGTSHGAVEIAIFESIKFGVVKTIIMAKFMDSNMAISTAPWDVPGTQDIIMPPILKDFHGYLVLISALLPQA